MNVPKTRQQEVEISQARQKINTLFAPEISQHSLQRCHWHVKQTSFNFLHKIGQCVSSWVLTIFPTYWIFIPFTRQRMIGNGPETPSTEPTVCRELSLSQTFHPERETHLGSQWRGDVGWRTNPRSKNKNGGFHPRFPLLSGWILMSPVARWVFVSPRPGAQDWDLHLKSHIFSMSTLPDQSASTTPQGEILKGVLETSTSIFLLPPQNSCFTTF